jgi:tRNA nucleotidyltransferase (CCA-adding enzyme)
MKEDLKALPGDRLVKELDKVLMSPYPSKFFDFLAEIGCLGIHFEEIEALDVPDKHDGTAYRHTMNLLDRAKGRFPLKIMYGLLTHDLGKGVTPSQDHPCHYNHDKLGVTLVKDMADRLRFTAEHKRFGMDSSRYHLVLRKLPEMKPGKALKYLFIRDVEDLMLVAYLDAIYRDGANTMIETPIYNEMKKLFLVSQRVAQEITGKDLIAEGIEPGPKLGDILFMRRTELFKKLRIDPRV